jgi:hypothetical protein
LKKKDYNYAITDSLPLSIIQHNNHGIKIQFFVARTPQQNGVVERKKRTIPEMA